MVKRVKKSGTVSAQGGLGNTSLNPGDRLRARGWCWTLNNYTEEEYNKLKSNDTLDTLKIGKMVIGLEKGKFMGTPHLQGYYYFDNAVSFSTLKKLIPKGHIERAKGSPSDNFLYCSKEGNFVSRGFKSTKKKLVDWFVDQDYESEVCKEHIMEFESLGGDEAPYIELDLDNIDF